MKYDPNEPEAWPNTKNEVRMSEVASWLSAISDVFGACIRARFPMYPTLDPSRTMRAMKTVSESKMTEGRKGAITNSWGNEAKESYWGILFIVVCLTLNENFTGDNIVLLYLIWAGSQSRPERFFYLWENKCKQSLWKRRARVRAIVFSAYNLTGEAEWKIKKGVEFSVQTW